jgi:hypothetical protein
MLIWSGLCPLLYVGIGSVRVTAANAAASHAGLPLDFKITADEIRRRVVERQPTIYRPSSARDVDGSNHMNVSRHQYLNGLILTESTEVPIGSVLGFATAADVSNFFGATSPEANAANIYFLGFDNSTKKPGTLLFAQYPDADVAAYLRSASLAGMTLDQLKALSGPLIVTVDGTQQTSGTIDLSGATSFSAAAQLIESGFTSDVDVSYNAQHYATANQFQFFYLGQISGEFEWIDSYVNQIWLNNALQQADMTLLTQVNSVPYNVEGRPRRR